MLKIKCPSCETRILYGTNLCTHCLVYLRYKEPTKMRALAKASAIFLVGFLVLTRLQITPFDFVLGTGICLFLAARHGFRAYPSIETRIVSGLDEEQTTKRVEEGFRKAILLRK